VIRRRAFDRGFLEPAERAPSGRTVFLTSTGAQIGTLRNTGGGRFRGSFTRPTNPQSITVKRSLGGSTTGAVAAK
jgi:hypothetical protein